MVALAFSADGAWLASGAGGWGSSDPIVRVWNVASGGLFAELEGHPRNIQAVAFHPTRPDLLASGSQDSTVCLWDVRSQQLLAMHAHASPPRFSRRRARA